MFVMKVLIEAYTRLNLGDDLFIYAVINKYPNIDFYVISDFEGYDTIFKNNSNLHIININKKNDFPLNMLESGTIITNNMELKIELLKRVDATIVIGGSMFIQSEKWREWQIEYYKHLFYFSRWSPVFFIGCNFGPYYTEDYYNEFKEIFKQARDICFREKFSYDMFKDLDNVRYSTDVIFSLKPYIDKIIRTKKDKKRIGISIISLRDRKDLFNIEEAYFQKLKEIVSKYCKNGYKVSIFPFCNFEGDLEAAKYVYNLLDEDLKKNCKICEYKDDIKEYLYNISIQSKMICSRFHSIILSLMFNQEIYPLIYSDKSYNILHDLNYKGKYCYIKDIESLNVDEMYTEIKNNKLSIYGLEQKANSQFDAFENYLRELM